MQFSRCLAHLKMRTLDWIVYMFWCTIVRSFQRANPTMLKKLFMWFQLFKGSKLWPNNTVNTKFCVKIFWGAHKSQPPRKCTVSHCANGPGWPLWTVNFLLLIAQLWPIMTQDDWRWSGLTHHGSWGCQGAYGGTQRPPGGIKLLPPRKRVIKLQKIGSKPCL